ncbi:uncharacterized protein LOC110452017 isoform X2 [Mizuhopecten yessoensis]|uniref:uncharacterized protein LOC110452017 isoform X2 n=1 Tax=Mizuhopecten yessoensis TaxID=6573 RepID=UPI000B45CC93|nr:uncharacterized protein LOC110452017 isoform X2 [Mizuhopecten yessoensis]
MDTASLLPFVCVLWTVQLYDVCSAARSGGSSSRTGSSNVASNSAGFVGGVDTGSPQFIIFMTIFGMLVLAVIIFLIIMCCKIRRYCCFNLPGFLPGSTDKIHIDSVNGSAARWSIASDPPQKKSPLPPLSVVADPEKKPNIPPIPRTKNGHIPRAKSPDSTEGLPPIYILPYPVPAGTDSFTPPPEPELSGSYSESEFDSESESATHDDDVDSALSDRSQSQLEDYYHKPK